MSLLLALQGSDTTAPVVTITVAPDRTRISDETGFTTTNFSFAVDEDYAAYEIRAVADAGTPRGAGTLVESGSGGLAGVNRAVDVTYSEWLAAALAEGTQILKVFAQDTSGNWSA